VHASPSLTASIVIPTRARPDYLAVALASIAPQAAQANAEVVVVDDAAPPLDAPSLDDAPPLDDAAALLDAAPPLNAAPPLALRALTERFGARYEPSGTPRGLNTARNTGVARSHGELVVFVDDDVQVADGWLAALLHASVQYPDVEIFTGPIRARLEGHPPRSCGREAPPVTTLDLGAHDTDAVRFAWGANMAVRRRALARVGPFDTSIAGGGDEQEWQERHGGPVMYVAGAALHHRRSARDARLRTLARTARTRGCAARRFDARRNLAPSLRTELTTLVGCLGHVVRHGCPAGLVMAAHSFGRLQEGVRERRP
jgi:GT2 family glycosyltransferase